MNTKIFILLTLISLQVNTAKNNPPSANNNTKIVSNNTKQIAAKKQPNHIKRQTLQTTQNLIRNVRRHKMVLKEMVEENNYEIIANKNSQLLNNVVGNSKGFKMFTKFSQIAAQIRQQQITHELNQTLEETLSKYLTLANRTIIGARGKKFYYLYEYKSFKSLVVDFREKKALIENLCNFGRKKNLLQCTYNLHGAYNQLFLYFNDLDLAVVSSPEFKDRFEEEIDQKYIEKLNKNQIEKMTEQYKKNIQKQSEKNLEKLKKLVNDLFHRKINVVSNVHESQLVKDKVYDEIVHYLNNKIYIRKSKDALFNFYSFHFVTSLEHLLAPVFEAAKNQKIPGITSPYRCYVYERTRVEDAIKDTQAFQDYLRNNKDKTLKKFKKNLKTFKNHLKNLDNNYSDNFLLEQLRSFGKSHQHLQIKSGKRSTKNLNVRSGLNRVVLRKQNDNQKISPNLKKTILERIIGFHIKVPKSRLVKRTMFFRKNYEQSKIGKQRSCEKSFYGFLETSADMFIGSESLDYRGDEIRIFGYIYRNDFYNKLYQKMRLLQDCLKKQPLTKSNEEVKFAYQKVIERYNQIHRLNHDYIELEIQYNINAIRKKLHGGEIDLNTTISDDERNRIELYKQHLKNQFYVQRGIEEEPSNQIDPTIAHPETSQSTIMRQPLETPRSVDLNNLSSDQESEEKNIKQKIVHKNLDASFQSESDSIQISDEQLIIEMQDLTKEIEKYERINQSVEQDSDSSQISNELQLQLQIQDLRNDSSDEEELEVIKPQLDIQNLNKSKMYRILLKIQEIDQQMQQWSTFKSYQKSAYLLFSSINLINSTVQDNSFNEAKKGTWIVLKFKEDYFSDYIQQLKQFQLVLVKFYSIEGDQLNNSINILLNYINQEIHITKGFYYERYFIEGDDGSESEEQSAIDMSKVPNYNARLNLNKIKASKLNAILIQLLFDINKKFIDLLQNDEDPSQFEQDIEKLIETLNVLLDDENLILKTKFNQKKNRYINYGLFKFKSLTYDDLEKDINKIITDLINDDQISKDIKDDLQDIINFFNKLRKTRAYYYEITNAEFDNNMNFIRYDSDDQNLSIEEDSSESSKQNKTQRDPKGKVYSFDDSSDEEGLRERSQYNSDDYIYTSSDETEHKKKTATKQKKLSHKGEAEVSQDNSIEVGQYEISNSNSIITESLNEESSNSEKIQKGTMYLDNIVNSKLYKPLLNLQNIVIKDKDFVVKFNMIVMTFNAIVDVYQFHVSSIKKVKNRQVIMGTYHYQNDLADKFLTLIENLYIYLEEQGGHQLLVDDLKYVVNTFKIFISTRQFYHESYLILLDQDQNEISKPLYDFDLESVNTDDFELIDDQDDGKNINNKKKQKKQLSQGASDDESSSGDHLPNQSSQDQKNKLALENSSEENQKIKVSPKNLTVEDSSEDQETINQNKNKNTVQKIIQSNYQHNLSGEQELAIDELSSTERNSLIEIQKNTTKKRKIYVIEILACEDCMEDQYIQRIIE